MKNITLPLPETLKISIIGLGYVGLPLAMAFARKFDVLGFDISSKRIQALNNGEDVTNEFSSDELANSSITFACDNDRLSSSDIFIIAVPTPVTDDLAPDLSMLREASALVAQYLQGGNIVVYESTVYPGATEEECLPILEKISGLRLNQDFYLGYSPERINPSDKVHKLENITKIVAGSDKFSANVIDTLYSSIIDAGTFLASSIKVAEAAKVIENTQRDLNIALINEFAKIFSLINLDTEEVLKAAETKWNFIPFRPGLVGGHCIGVDPYYLTYKAKKLGYDPQVILSGRAINDGMPHFIAEQLFDRMLAQSINLNHANILILGYSFKENCNDIRNTKVHDLALDIKNMVFSVDVYDPIIDVDDRKKIEHISFEDNPKKDFYDAVILAVAHDAFRTLGIEKIRSFCKSEGIIYDLKHVFPAHQVDMRL
jgi:UDP-N-acetyl-D-glucosamine/UDP-N-acetyl-D-galactosamine dehydrogenase